MGLFDTVTGNGGALISGNTSQVTASASTRDKIVGEMIGGAVAVGLEATRKSQGKSWIAFYGGISWEWLKKNWWKLLLWIIIPGATILVIWKVIRRLSKRKRR